MIFPILVTFNQDYIVYIYLLSDKNTSDLKIDQIKELITNNLDHYLENFYEYYFKDVSIKNKKSIDDYSFYKK